MSSAFFDAFFFFFFVRWGIIPHEEKHKFVVHAEQYLVGNEYNDLIKQTILSLYIDALTRID